MYVSEEEMGLCSRVIMFNVHDVALRCNTIRNVALWSMTGWPLLQ